MEEKSEKEHFRQIVRRVLKAMDYWEPTYGDFRLWDGLIDWRETAELMEKKQSNTALCHILDKHGKIVKCEGKPVVVARDIEASTGAEAAEILSQSSHVFLRWWPSDSPKRPDADDNQRKTQNNTENEQGTSKDYRTRAIAATRGFFAGRKRPKRQAAGERGSR